MSCEGAAPVVQRRNPSISVVMVSYRTGPSLFGAVQSVLAAPDVDELVLVNHQNPPEAEARLRALSDAEPRLRLIFTGANLGFAKGCNIGARAARGAHFLFLNPDAVLQPGGAARMLETGAALAEPWIVGARLLNADGREQRGSRRGELTLVGAAAGYLGLARLFPRLRDIHREREPVPEAAVETPTISGAAMMMSRAGYEGLGGFDEAFFLHVEDIDICKRARLAGGAVVFEPRVCVTHIGSTSQVSLFKVEAWKASGLVRYFARHCGRISGLVAAAMAPLIYAAVLGRAAVIKTHLAADGALRRLHARARLSRMRRRA